ncbi:DoxX family protein [Streptomyces sp. NBS 14/10]|uniref:DoxX family protein n=1 Tax=Streptomyces sp. NBS 14/10 TaxID=1945643 RepID=UPI000B7E8D11|nr:DoxX family protein [Streptomyces sp. NBS 14/10]KAK1184778.1 DoxX family protein [Streptomyces sp. NBS 14/10]
MSAYDPAPAQHRSSSPRSLSHVLVAHDVGLLVMRLGVGLTVAARGSQHLLGWWGGLGIENTSRLFEKFGYPAPKFMAVVAGITETFGGLALAVGLLTPLAGAAVAGTMANAVNVVWPLGFFGGFEFPLLIGVGAAGLALSGPGRIAVDAVIPGVRSHHVIYGVVTLLIAAVLAAITIGIRD